MPPRYAYWVIILEGTATSFRARSREELLPTFNRLKAKDPSATMKWFERGKLFDTPEEGRKDRLKQAGLWEERPPAGPPRDRRPRAAGSRGPGFRGPGSRGPDREGASRRPPRPGMRGRPDAHAPGDGGARRPQGKGPGPHAPGNGGARRPQGKGPGPHPPGDGGARRPRGKGPDERRGKEWRPGGEHRDPRDKYAGKPGDRRKRWKRRFFEKRDAGAGPRGAAGRHGAKDGKTKKPR